MSSLATAFVGTALNKRCARMTNSASCSHSGGSVPSRARIFSRVTSSPYIKPACERNQRVAAGSLLSTCSLFLPIRLKQRRRVEASRGKPRERFSSIIDHCSHR